MVEIFSGLVWTSYGQLYLVSGSREIPLPDETFFGQANGLCGAAVAGALFLITGTHTGAVPVRVVVVESSPAVGDWEEVVEVSFIPDSPRAVLLGWDGETASVFYLPASSYRVRWSASGMDAGKDQDVADDASPAPDRYELAFWPAPAGPDKIVRTTSRTAGGWHASGFGRDVAPNDGAVEESALDRNLRNATAGFGTSLEDG